jgi:myo-inositol-1(or 4)-monophosphatase
MDAREADSVRARLEPLVRQAGDHLLRSFEHLDHRDVDSKATSIDLVTRLDLESQALLQQGLERLFPGEEIVAEEGAERRARSGRVWLVDPLDGTTNFVHGLPIFAVSVARLTDGEIELGMIYAPYLREMYWGAANCGARLGARSLRVSQRARLEDALLATGFPYDIRTNPENNLREWSHLATRSRALRRCGAAALDLAWVAAGRFDGFWEFRLGPWDLAAGALLVRESGGRLSDPGGGPDYLWSGDLVATNGHLHDRLLAELGAVRRARSGGAPAASGNPETPSGV